MNSTMQNDEDSFTNTTTNKTVEPKVLSSAHDKAYFGLWVLVSTVFMAAVVPMFYID